MQDWQAIQLGNFRKKNISFNLEKTIKEVENLMKSRALAKNLNLKVHTNFDKELQMAEIISIEEILKDTLASN